MGEYMDDILAFTMLSGMMIIIIGWTRYRLREYRFFKQGVTAAEAGKPRLALGFFLKEEASWGFNQTRKTPAFFIKDLMRLSSILTRIKEQMKAIGVDFDTADIEAIIEDEISIYGDKSKLNVMGSALKEEPARQMTQLNLRLEDARKAIQRSCSSYLSA